MKGVKGRWKGVKVWWHALKHDGEALMTLFVTTEREREKLKGGGKSLKYDGVR